ncbi:MAG: hypothetical protein OXL41_11480 [Nitrospinae bacterium]|nr:hypothetical protein [Nitrospinota bacterium]
MREQGESQRSSEGAGGAGLVKRRAKRERARTMADDVKKVAMLADRGVGPLPQGCWAR